ncbi:hypothetical protein BHE74_00059486 [Ensete ventricosum]|nr:hypothetical protein GW17_00058603 [Ensete ventricosum]RWW35566.1 hypothetical protein BHE74_00059486 [Ensete ventricosum]RZS24242.1 hypothetical protein BHM03_00057294 [Ensete ventricosum]
MHLLDCDPSPIQSPLHPSSAHKTHSYLQAKIDHKANQTRAAKLTASSLLAVQGGRTLPSRGLSAGGYPHRIAFAVNHSKNT